MSLKEAQTALDHAWTLVRKGEVIDALYWATQASSLDSGLEEAWLIMAALSDPHESFEYLKKALDINPFSRRGNNGVAWAESKTGWSFTEYVSGFKDFSTESPKPFKPDNYPAIDLSALESASNQPVNVWLQEDEPEVVSYEQAEKPPEISPPPPPIEPPQMIIRRKRPRPLPPEPVNPWSVLLPYTVSFILFLFLATLWLLSGLPNVKAYTEAPDYTTDELVQQILAANPTPTRTLTPSSTPLPTKTPTIIPTITPTFTPQPTATPIPPTEEVITDEDGDGTIPVLVGDQIAYTLDDGRWIDVDLAQQKVSAYAGEKKLREFLVSTGTAAHPTVKGNFHIYIKNRYADMSGPGYFLPNVPYTMYFYQSYGLHGTYWHHNFGTPMSHGCVNLKTDDAAWLFKWASVGTLVHVH
jgi:lipoprotein-anchoring transpeptidase ErfK/SrfK